MFMRQLRELIGIQAAKGDLGNDVGFACIYVI